MEKYTNWRDKGTGISPFLPNKNKSKIKQNSLVNLVLIPIEILISIIRLPFIIIFFIFYNLFYSINTLKLIFLTLFKYSIGLFKATVTINGTRRGKKYNKLSEIANSGGDLIISNYVSALDSLIYTVFNPYGFVVPVKESNDVYNLKLFKSFFAFFMFTIGYPSPKDENAVESVNDKSINVTNAENTNNPDIALINRSKSKYDNNKNLSNTDIQLIEYINEAKKNKKPLVIFPEGITSNGNALLQFPLQINFYSIVNSINNTIKIYPAVIKYNPNSLTTPIPISFFKILFNLLVLNCFGWYANVKLGENFFYSFKTDEPLNIDKSFNLAIRKSIMDIGKFREVGSDLGIESKREFIKKYKK